MQSPYFNIFRVESGTGAAEAALTTANGKNTVYYGATMPTGTFKKNDLWYDSDDDNKLYIYNGSTWTPAPMGENAIADNSISTGHIMAGAITAAKIAANTITANNMAADSITAAAIKAGTITSTEIAAGTIKASNLKAATITGDKIAATTITAGNLAADCITSDKIVSNAITTDKLAANSVNASKILANSITAAQIAAGTITAVQIKAGTITADLLSAGTIQANLAYIANFKIANNYIASNGCKSYITGMDSAVYIGTDGIGLGKNFRVDAKGNAVMANADITGKITAKSGNIGGFTITETYIGNATQFGAYDDSVYISPTKGISLGKKFLVDTDGNLTAKSVNMSGTITAIAGKIGGFTIGDKALYTGTAGTMGIARNVYLGTDGISVSDNFKVDATGKATLTSADITGSITTYDGTIGGFTINAKSISNGTQYFGGNYSSVYMGTDGISCGTSFTVDKSGYLITAHAFMNGTWESNAWCIFDADVGIQGTYNNRKGSILDLGSDGYISVGWHSYNGNFGRTDIYGRSLYMHARDLFYSTTAMQVVSDQRMKKDISDLSDDLVNLFMEIRPVSFRWKDRENQRIQMGVISQEVIKTLEDHHIDYHDYDIIGEVLNDGQDSTDENTYYSVNYDNLHMITLAMTQRQERRIAALEEKVRELSA